MFIAVALLVFAISLLSACAQNPTEKGVDASAARAEAQGNDGQSSDEPTLAEDSTPMPEPTMMTGTMMEMTGSMLTSGGFPKYRVTKNGDLIIEGDMLVRCADLLQNYWEGQSPTPEARRQMRQESKEQVKVCTKAGFPPNKTPQSP